MCSDVQNRVGTPHIKMCSDVRNKVGTPHIKMCLHVLTRVGTCQLVYLIRCSNYGGDTAQDRGCLGGWWVVGNYSDNNATSWLHLASWTLPDSQLS